MSELIPVMSELMILHIALMEFMSVISGRTSALMNFTSVLINSTSELMKIMRVLMDFMSAISRGISSLTKFMSRVMNLHTAQPARETVRNAGGREPVRPADAAATAGGVLPFRTRRFAG